MAYPQDRTTVSATRARQGRLGRNVMWVLVFGIVLTVIGFVATWAWKAGDLGAAQRNLGRDDAPPAAKTFNAPPPTPSAARTTRKARRWLRRAATPRTRLPEVSRRGFR